MSNPLSAIRKHQAKLLVIFGIIIMFSFTVGPIIIQVLQSVGNRSPVSHEVVLTWNGGTLREQDFDEMRVAHSHLMRLQEEIVHQVTENKGSPKVPPMADDDSDQTLAMTTILARKAKEAGIVISDDDAENYLYQLGDGQIPRPRFAEIAESLNVDYDLALKQLKQELTALNLVYVVQGSAGGVSPVDAWEYFNRLHRSVTMEVLPLPVEDYLDDVTTEPSESEIQALYDKHKYDYKLPNSTDPGFKRPLRIALSYVRADYEQFLDRAKANITDEQVKEDYEKNKDLYRVPILDEGPGDKSPDGDKPETDSTDKPNGESSDGDKPTTDATDKPDSESPDGDKSAPDSTDTPSDDSSDGDAPPTTDSSDNSKADKGGGEAPTTDSTDETDAEPTRGDETDSSNCDDPVSAASDESSSEPSGDENDAASGDDEPRPANGQPGSEPADHQDDESGDQTDSPPDNPSNGQPENPSDGQPENSATDKSDAGDDPTTTDPELETPKDRYRPLEEVADQIRGKLARAPAQAEMIAAIRAVESAVNRYQPRYKRWQVLTQKNPSALQPEPPDPQELARTYGLTAGTTPLVDMISIREYDIGKLSDTNEQFRGEAFREGVPEYKASYGFDTQWGRQFFAQGLVAGDVAYVYWRTSIALTEVPELDEIRDDVVYAWKLQQARTLALEDARQKAREASQAGSLKDLYGEATITVGPFTWMRSLAVPSGGGNQAVLSELPDIEQPGEEFMRSVFSLEKGDTGVAVNAPESVVYVVRIVDQSPTDKELRERFFRSRPNTSDIQSIGQGERYALMADWYRGLAKEMDVQWKREPKSSGR